MNTSGLPLYLAAVACIGFGGIYLYRKSLEHCLLYILYALPLMGLLATKTSLGGFKIFDLLSIGCLALFPKTFFRGLSSLSRSTGWLFLAFVLLLLIGSLASEFPQTSLLALLQVLPAFVYCRLLVVVCYVNPTFYSQVLRALRFSSYLLLVFIAVQLVVGLSFTFYPALNQNTYDPLHDTIRYPGFFHDSQASGQFLAIASFLFLYSSRDEKSLKQKLLHLGLFAACGVGVLLSGSRSALGGLLVGMVLLLLCGGWRLQVSVLSLGILVGSLYLLASPNLAILNRADNIDEDYKFRQSVWQEAWDISLNNPGLGIGIGNFQSYTSMHKQELYLEIDDEIVYFDQPENGYLKVLTEIGFVGFGIFLSFLLRPAGKTLIGFYNKTLDYKVLFILAAFTGWLFSFNTVYSLFDSRITIVVATLLALLITHPIKDGFLNEQAS